MERKEHQTATAILLIVSLISNTVFAEYDNYQGFTSDNGGERGLFPNIFNLAANSLIHADATCGQKRREIYCKLVEHVFNR